MKRTHEVYRSHDEAMFEMHGSDPALAQHNIPKDAGRAELPISFIR